ncbi:hira-interacting protein 5 [Ceraceosorus bombacis]|uniref:Hira-interacting protein 5 n=1 Tax=Ceraceosorus bombacis TaxID=401625 RepID=A0A0P1BIX7_9BASI|nr:hira-interacting protein 5 [Ceraceosorus bombacis]
MSSRSLQALRSVQRPAFAAQAIRSATSGSSVRGFACSTPGAHSSRLGPASTANTQKLSLRPTVPVAGAIFGRQQSRSMFIQTESTPNEDSLKFLPGQQVMQSGTAEFTDTRSSMTSPLAKTLFGLNGVKTVFFGPDFVTVSKDSETQWSTLKPEIYSTIMEHFTAGRDLFLDPESAQGSSDTIILDTDSETVAMIKELLDTRVRPAIQEDGGDIEYRGFDEDGDRIVRLKLKGSCRGCSSSAVTLKTGIERMLKHYIPEVEAVEQVLDQEEEIALDEFAKLESKLNKDRARESQMGFSH